MLRHADDERLAALAAAGSSDAFDVLVQRHEARLLMVSRRVLRSDDDARDAVQNALLKAFRALQAGQLRGAPRPWLSRIAHREACSLARVRREFAPLDADAFGFVGGDPHEAVLVKERLATLVADVAALPERLRAPLLLRAETGLSYDEIGRSLGVSGTAARQAVFAARDVLTEEADARDADCASIRTILAESDLRRLRSRRVRGHLKACAACRAFRPAPRARFSLFGAGGLAWNLVSWINGLFTTSATTAGAAFRSTAVVAAVAGGSLSLGAADRHADLGRAAAQPQPTPTAARDKGPEIAGTGGGATWPLPDASWTATSSPHDASGGRPSAGPAASTRRDGTLGGGDSPSRRGASAPRGGGSSSDGVARGGGSSSHGGARTGGSSAHGTARGGGSSHPAARGGGAASHGGGAMSYGAGRGGGSSPHGGPRSGSGPYGAGRGGGTASYGAGSGGVGSHGAEPGSASTSDGVARGGGAASDGAASGGASASNGAAPGDASASDGGGGVTDRAASGGASASNAAVPGGVSASNGAAPDGASASDGGARDGGAASEGVASGGGSSSNGAAPSGASAP